MKRKITAGQTGVSMPIFVSDTSSTTGGGLAGLTSATSGLIAEYRRQGQSAWTAITLTTKTLGTWVSGGIVANGSLAGRYELDIPDATGAIGAKWAEVCLRGAANMLPVLIEIELDAVDYQNATSFGLSRIDVAVSTAVSDNAGIAAIKAKTDNLPAAPAAVGSAMTLAANQDVRNVTGTVNGLVAPDNVSIAAIKLKTDNLPATPAAVGSAMTLTTAERTAVANEVEAQIIDDTDSEKVLTAITDKIAAANPSLAGLTIAAIASGVWGNGTRTLTSGANIVLAKGVGITGLNDIPAGSSMTLAANQDVRNILGTVNGQIAPDNTSIAAIKAKTDNLPAAPAAVGSAMTLSGTTRVQLATVQPDYAPSKAGDAMSLTTGERNAINALIETELINDATGGAFMQAIADKLTAVFDIENLTIATISTSVRDAILNRVLAGNHDTAGTLGKVVQDNTATLNAMDSRLSSTRVGYLDKLNVGGTLAQVGSAMTLATDSVNAASVATSAVSEIQAGLMLSSSYVAPDNTNIAANLALTNTINTKFGNPVLTTFSADIQAIQSGGSSSAGLPADTQAQIDDIQAHTALIASGGFSVTSPVTARGNIITAKSGDAWTIPLTGVGVLTARTKLWFAVKSFAGDHDSDSLIFIEESAGLLVVSGSTATSNLGAITVSNASTGALSIAVDGSATVGITSGPAYWAIKARIAGRAVTLVEGQFVITTRRIEAV